MYVHDVGVTLCLTNESVLQAIAIFQQILKVFQVIKKHVSQDLTFLHLVWLLYQSSRPMQWVPHPNVCGKCPLGAHHPQL